jgi:HK97 gp10 family phage protein
MIKASVQLVINDKLIKDLLEKAEADFINSSEEMKDLMIDSIKTGSKSGKTYTRNGMSHQSSAPGQPPANDTGKLIDSIKVEKRKNTSTIKIDADYAGYLEYGTSKMRPRPFILPALMKIKKKLMTMIKRNAR